MQRVILNSGGLDSCLLALQPKWRDAIHVFVDIGQAYRHKERASAYGIAEALGARFEIVQGAQIARFEHKSGIIPYRNAEMILCAAQFGDIIGLGVIADEVNSDKSPEFFMAMRAVLNISHVAQYWTDGKHHSIETPLINRTKAEHISDYLNSGGDLGILLRTVSCYDGGDRHCGRCASCFKRWVALTVATGNPEVDTFVVAPWAGYDLDYLRARLPTYSVKRVLETRQAFDTVGITL